MIKEIGLAFSRVFLEVLVKIRISFALDTSCAEFAEFWVFCNYDYDQ